MDGTAAAMDAAALWARLATDERGLVPAVVTHAMDRRVLMVGYMDAEALEATFARGRVCFHSRSRGVLWEKGETSGHTLEVASMRVDCDLDTILIEANPRGPTCHTGTTSCFFRRIEGGDPGALPEDDGPARRPGASLEALFSVIEDRKAGRGLTSATGHSYVQHLLRAGVDEINDKIEEESAELRAALARESDAQVLGELADVLFHALVGLASRDLTLADLAGVLDARHGVSGIDEKASRTQGEKA